MIGDGLTLKFHGGLRFSEANKLCGDNPTLMHQLIEAVLPVGARFTKDNGSGFDPGPESDTFSRDTLSITFHVKLLDMCWEFQEGLAIG